MKSEILTIRNKVVATKTTLTIGDVVAVKPTVAVGGDYSDVDDPQNIAAASPIQIAVYTGGVDCVADGQGPASVGGVCKASVGEAVTAGDLLQVSLVADVFELIQWNGAGATTIGAGEAEAWANVGRGVALETIAAPGLCSVRIMNNPAVAG